MSREPQIEQRDAQPYVGIRTPVTMDGFPAGVDNGFPELFGWVAQHGLAPAGPPFIRYLVIDMERELEIELAVPVEAEVDSDGRIRSDVLPGGRYVTLRHVGPYDGLMASNAALQRWAEEHGIAFETWDTDSGSAWRSRVEYYITDPAAEPDPAKLEVDLAYLTTESRTPGER